MDSPNSKERRQSDSSQVPGISLRRRVCAFCGSRNLKFHGFRELQSGVKRRRLICANCGRTQYTLSEIHNIQAERRRKERERNRSLRLFIKMFPELDHTNGYVQKW
jgi:hypothetical protein